MAKRKSLGRGLDALLSSRAAPEAPAAGAETMLKELPVDLLSRGRYQPRADMREETLAELAESIRAQGIVQPIVARPAGRSPDGEQRYEIVAGERRWRAAQMAGLATVPALVKEIPDEAAVAVALIENIQRENLNPVEEARALKQLVDDFAMTHAEAAEAVGRSRAAVSNLLRLLELPPVVRELLERRELDMGHARALLAIPSAELKLEMARRVAREGWSVRETERAVRRLVEGGPKAGRAKVPEKDANIRRLEQRVAEVLGARVSIEHGTKGGRVVVRYNDLDELEGILEHIN
jgi:ParB family transcriptional regulator, chromosome partitioning protein